MLERYLSAYITELKLGNVDFATNTPGVYSIPFDQGVVDMMDIPNGYQLKCAFAPFPKKDEELFLTQAMLGNLFGQGTRGAVLGLSPDGSQLTMTLNIDYPSDYKYFKESLDDFLTAVNLWRDEAANPTPVK